ncbi:acetyltransferase [Sansalvadorimonas sp. 2012CJ34-2]|uniref:Acetyltransferase n=1 Tax=Parendozoicomonas callyspongiae TaxID=2942213 RepID=A0ABT0PKH0_9GAMM|nr:acetyltransferase [Sansalvadorimonas sp. 2012CJ34-2]MCL6271884.1 acetyltransferase [Sansalvadorimonas sp. 2012CJ34-2]
MREVYIIGSGGFAAELTGYIQDNNKIKNQLRIKGYFDVNTERYSQYNFPAPFLGSENNFNFHEGDLVIIAIGDLKIRSRIIENLKNKKVTIDGFCHNSSIVSSSAVLGSGNIICPNVIIGPNTTLGDNNILNYSSALPHDCTLGSENVFSPNVQITGYTTIGDKNFFGTSSCVLPNLSIGNCNKIQAGLVVSKNVENSRMVFKIEKTNDLPSYDFL